MNVNNEIEHSSAPFASQGDLTDRMRAGNMMMMDHRGQHGVDLSKVSSISSNNDGCDLKKFSGDLQGSPDKLKRSSPLLQKVGGEKPSPTKKQSPTSAAAATTAAKKVKHNPSADKSSSSEVKKRRTRKKWKKPKDKPNRPLSAYNLFFQAERASMLGDDAKLSETDKAKKRVHRKTHGKIGFAEMARSIGQLWKELPEEIRKPYLEEAAKEKKRYAVELEVWKKEQEGKQKPGKSLVAALKAEKLAAEREGASSVEQQASGSAKDRADEALKLKMMAEEINQRNMALMQQRSETEYLRALQERKMALLASRSAFDSSLFQYPSASEASANALMQQFQGVTGMGPLGLNMNPMGMNMNMNPMGMNAMNMNMNPLGMNAMNMNMNPLGMNAMKMMAAADLQQRQAQLGAASRLQQLRASLGDLQGVGNSAMGTSNNTTPSGTGNNGQGDLGRDQYAGNERTTAAVATRLQSRFNM